jgi:hypothetical protein
MTDPPPIVQYPDIRLLGRILGGHPGPGRRGAVRGDGAHPGRLRRAASGAGDGRAGETDPRIAEGLQLSLNAIATALRNSG